MIAVRDAAPFAYSAVAFLSAHAYGASDACGRRRTVRLIESALLFHLAWVAIVMLLPNLSTWIPIIPGGTVRMFSLQLSNDGVILGITAAFYLNRHLRSGGNARLAIAITCLALMAAMASRGALLGTIAVVLLTLVLHARTPVNDMTLQRRLGLMVVLPLLVCGVVFTLPHTVAGSKLLASMGIIQATTKADHGGIETAAARSAAWSRVEEYVEERGAAVSGVGFGPNFMVESGASIALVSGNNQEIRSPHNILVTLYARMGIVGLLLFLGMFGAFAFRLVKLPRWAAGDDLILLGAIVPVGILVTALFGPMLDGPFGAVPFFWFLGITLSGPINDNLRHERHGELELAMTNSTVSTMADEK